MLLLNFRDASSLDLLTHKQRNSFVEVQRVGPPLTRLCLPKGEPACKVAASFYPYLPPVIEPESEVTSDVF